MKLKFLLLFLVAIACALPCRADRLETIPNRTAEPLPVVDIRDERYSIVAHLFVPPGETMLLDANEKPAGGAGYYEAMPGEDYFLIVPLKFQLPQLGKESCPCVLHMDKIAWNRAGTVTSITGLRPYMETSSAKKIPITSDVNRVRIANGKIYFKLKGHGSSEYWLLTRYGQVVESGGPWGLWETAFFLFLVVLPVTLAALLAISIAGALRLLHEDSHPEKSFIELMQHSFMSLPLVKKLRRESEWDEWED